MRNPKQQFRLEPEVLALVQAECERRGMPLATWYRLAVLDKLKHSARSRRQETAEIPAGKPRPIGRPKKNNGSTLFDGSDND